MSLITKRTGITSCFTFLLLMGVLLLSSAQRVCAQEKPRARDLGVPFDGTPGPLNAITDVAGVEVGHATLLSGSGKLVVGKGPIRTGVSAVYPLGKTSLRGVAAGWFALPQLNGPESTLSIPLPWSPEACRSLQKRGTAG